MILATVSWAEKLSAYSTLAATIVQAAAFVAGLYVLCLTIRQLKGLNHTLKLTALSGLLQLEADMCARKAKLDDISAEALLDRAKREMAPPKTYQESKFQEAQAENVKVRQRTAKENWFNAVDRLCFVILKGYWQGIDWRAEYEDYLKQIVESHHDWFEPHIYPNIVALHNQWQAAKK
jgi:hypothetical protein